MQNRLLFCFLSVLIAAPAVRAQSLSYHWLTGDQVLLWRTGDEAPPVTATRTTPLTVSPPSAFSDAAWIRVLSFNHTPADTQAVWHAALDSLSTLPDNDWARARYPDVEVYVLDGAEGNEATLLFLNASALHVLSFSLQPAPGAPGSLRWTNGESEARLRERTAVMDVFGLGNWTQNPQVAAIFSTDPSLPLPDGPDALGDVLSAWLNGLPPNTTRSSFYDADGRRRWVWQERLTLDAWIERGRFHRVMPRELLPSPPARMTGAPSAGDASALYHWTDRDKVHLWRRAGGSDWEHATLRYDPGSGRAAVDPADQASDPAWRAALDAMRIEADDDSTFWSEVAFHLRDMPSDAGPRPLVPDTDVLVVEQAPGQRLVWIVAPGGMHAAGFTREGDAWTGPASFDLPAAIGWSGRSAEEWSRAFPGSAATDSASAGRFNVGRWLDQFDAHGSTLTPYIDDAGQVRALRVEFLEAAALLDRGVYGPTMARPRPERVVVAPASGVWAWRVLAAVGWGLLLAFALFHARLKATPQKPDAPSETEPAEALLDTMERELQEQSQYAERLARNGARLQADLEALEARLEDEQRRHALEIEDMGARTSINEDRIRAIRALKPLVDQLQEGQRRFYDQVKNDAAASALSYLIQHALVQLSLALAEGDEAREAAMRVNLATICGALQSFRGQPNEGFTEAGAGLEDRAAWAEQTLGGLRRADRGHRHHALFGAVLNIFRHQTRQDISRYYYDVDSEHYFGFG